MANIERGHPNNEVIRAVNSWGNSVLEATIESKLIKQRRANEELARNSLESDLDGVMGGSFGGESSDTDQAYQSIQMEPNVSYSIQSYGLVGELGVSVRNESIEDVNNATFDGLGDTVSGAESESTESDSSDGSDD